jgi:hypothetical protein
MRLRFFVAPKLEEVMFFAYLTMKMAINQCIFNATFLGCKNLEGMYIIEYLNGII